MVQEVRLRSKVQLAATTEGWSLPSYRAGAGLLSAGCARCFLVLNTTAHAHHLQSPRPHRQSSRASSSRESALPSPCSTARVLQRLIVQATAHPSPC